MASLAGSFDIKSLIVVADGNLLDTSSTFSHFLWLNFLGIAVLQSGRWLRTLLANCKDRLSMLGKFLVSSATLLIMNFRNFPLEDKQALRVPGFTLFCSKIGLPQSPHMCMPPSSMIQLMVSFFGSSWSRSLRTFWAWLQACLSLFAPSPRSCRCS